MDGLNGLVQEAMEILDTIYMATDMGIVYLHKGKIEDFQSMLHERETLFQQLVQVREQILNRFSARMKDAEIAEINQKIGSKIQIIAKVDREAFDIIDRMKKDLLEKMKQGRKGKVFLQKYREQVNHQKIIQRTI